MGQIMIMVGSHTINKSVSYYLGKQIQKIFMDKGQFETSLISVNQKLTDKMISQILNAIALILIAPIYIDSPPSKVLRWMAEMEANIVKSGQGIKLKYFAVISNCGFYEADHNKLAIRIYQCFAEKIAIEYIRGVGFGCGQLITNAKIINNADEIIEKPILETLNSFAQDILDKIKEAEIPSKSIIEKNIYVNFNVTREEYEDLTNLYWLSLGTANGLEKQDYYKRSFNNANEES